jgi:carnitine O-acetyltransferase
MFAVPAECAAAFPQARAALRELAAPLDVHAFRFREFGRGQLKGFGVSPDAAFQMALQLAYHRVHGRVAPTYETAHTRLFARGRTETIRSCSLASAALCKAWAASGTPPSVLAALFRDACRAHVAYTHAAMKGAAVDRHLLGLRLAARELGLPPPAFFADKGFTESTTFRLSTSSIGMAHQTYPCFGPVVADGFGVCYNLRPTELLAGVTCYTAGTGHTAAQFGAVLADVLRDLRRVIQQAGTGPAKL